MAAEKQLRNHDRSAIPAPIQKSPSNNASQVKSPIASDTLSSPKASVRSDGIPSGGKEGTDVGSSDALHSPNERGVSNRGSSSSSDEATTNKETIDHRAHEEVEDTGEESESSDGEELAPFAKLVGIGDDNESSDDEAIMETMAVSDLPSKTLVEARIDIPALKRKLREIALFTKPIEDDAEDDDMRVATLGGANILPFRESLAVTMPFQKPLSNELAIDDLARETAFAERTAAAVHIGLAQLRAQKVKFRRPGDYFAEMVKTDEHMSKVKKGILRKKSKIEEAEKRRNNRDLKKNRRKVRQEQIEKEQDKKRKTREEIEAVSKLRTKRLRDRAQAAANPNDDDDDDEFPIEMLDVEKVDVDQVQKYSKGTRGKTNTSHPSKSAPKRKPPAKGMKPSRNPPPRGSIKKKVGKKKRLGKSRRLASKK